MLEANELDEAEVRKQVVLFTHALRSIVQGHPLCKDKAVVASFADETPGVSLADELCGLISRMISALTEEDMETDQMNAEHLVSFILH